MKKVLAVVLVAVALVAFFPMSANAANIIGSKNCVPGILRPCRVPMPPAVSGGNSNATKSGGSTGTGTSGSGAGRPLPPSSTR